MPKSSKKEKFILVYHNDWIGVESRVFLTENFLVLKEQSELFYFNWDKIVENTTIIKESFKNELVNDQKNPNSDEN